MRMLFVADLHYTLRQIDWLTANAGDYDLVIIGGDVLDLGSALDFDVRIVVVEKHLQRFAFARRQRRRRDPRPPALRFSGSQKSARLSSGIAPDLLARMRDDHPPAR